MKREDIDVMEAKARAALEEMPEDVKHARWAVDASCRDVSASNPDSEDIQRWDLVKPVHGGVRTSTLEHIAASDPHAVLALIAELRRVEQERDALKDQRYLWLLRVFYPSAHWLPPDRLLGKNTEGMDPELVAGLARFRENVEAMPERIFREAMEQGERVPWDDVGTDLLQKAAKDDAPPSDGFVIDGADRKPDDT